VRFIGENDGFADAAVAADEAMEEGVGGREAAGYGLSGAAAEGSVGAQGCNAM